MKELPEHTHASGEDLLELLFEPGPRSAQLLARARTCERCASEIVELERTLAAIDAALDREPASTDLTVFRSRVLSMTTREDLRLIGDVRIVLHYVTRELKASRALRLAAASLLLHLLVLPVLIWLVLRGGPEHASAGTPPDHAPELPLSGAPIDPRREPAPAAKDNDDAKRAAAALDPSVTAALASARRALLAAGAPSLDPDLGDPDPISRLLAARAERIRLGAWMHLLREPPPRAQALERALWAELLLDDCALAGRADPRLARALSALEEVSRAATPGARLAQRALDRARAYGLLDAPASGAGVQPTARAALQPFDPAWFDLLEAATAGTQASRTVERWLEWGRGARVRPR
jgi:hypothetical protein